MAPFDFDDIDEPRPRKRIHYDGNPFASGFLRAFGGSLGCCLGALLIIALVVVCISIAVVRNIDERPKDHDKISLAPDASRR